MQAYSLLFLLVLIASCQGPHKTTSPAGTADQSWQAFTNLPDHDPYFVETKAIVTSSGPNSITRNIIQDRKGNIWLATWEGILRYDGSGFTNFTNKAGLRRFHAFAALEDSRGNLWFATIGAGVYRYDGETFTNFTTKEGLPNDRVTNIYEDRKGNIWFGTEGGASRYDPTADEFRNFATAEGLTNNDVNVIVEDRTGKLWFGTRGSACFYDGKTFTRFANEEGAPFVNVRSIIEDREGHIWLGGNGGLWRYDPNAELNPFTNFTTHFVGYIYEDRRGNIWTSSEGANKSIWVLTRYEAASLHQKKPVATTIRTEEGMFFGIWEDTDGGVWLGTLNGVCRYDGEAFNCFSDTGE